MTTDWQTITIAVKEHNKITNDNASIVSFQSSHKQINRRVTISVTSAVKGRGKR
jgi:hypothetical protein